MKFSCYNSNFNLEKLCKYNSNKLFLINDNINLFIFYEKYITEYF